jgi:hypothetical protein
VAAITDRRDPLEAEIQKAILQYLARRRDLIFWRQNSGSFIAPVIRAVASVLSKFGFGRSKAAVLAAIKKSVGHYKCTSISGIPDITVVYRGMYVGLEVKTKKGRLTKDQKVLHERMLKLGTHVVIVRSVDDVIAKLKQIDDLFEARNANG